MLKAIKFDLTNFLKTLQTLTTVNIMPCCLDTNCTKKIENCKTFVVSTNRNNILLLILHCEHYFKRFRKDILTNSHGNLVNYLTLTSVSQNATNY